MAVRMPSTSPMWDGGFVLGCSLKAGTSGDSVSSPTRVLALSLSGTAVFGKPT
jgi:hypothetical protein